MFKGYVNYDVFKKEWSCHIDCYGEEIKAKTFKNKDQMLEYVKSNGHVNWMFPEEIGKMSY